ncbi:orotate phosphoribosyltransferase [Limosilactobacillus equigenerosi]|uniref:Orotate phosphoribosyltransferase n=1 Tax=Limosilactobacillus equigenerosi DSM 18793 = JCM 14505 TaxID=1423742 RepID=A0A0R1UKX5_9LACO|nr:orotate phosphoribosyltransferase [Limosilactobacillus equigenerosi]KRL93984.1 orotate phosphoribosyltransferase [Limosilactobacillus equigenerosi DSM 18793 = JCM 14505]
MKTIANQLLEIEAVKLAPEHPFTWASGIKSPIYCDNRLTISYPSLRRAITQALVDLIQTNWPAVEVIAGTATAGIPQAAWVAEQMNLPLVYVRSQPKDHGTGRQVEGVLPNQAKVVLIDDLISTGGSVLKAAQGVQNDGGEVIGVAGVFSYQLAAATTNFAAAGLEWATVTNYTELIEQAQATGLVTTEQLATLHQWRADPMHWQA